MSEESNAAASQAEITKSVADSETGLRRAHAALNVARNCFAGCLACYLVAAFVAPAWAGLLPLAFLALLVAAYVFLGMAAARAGKSWVVYAILPLLIPGLGGLISFGVLRSKVAYVDE